MSELQLMLGIAGYTAERLGTRIHTDQTLRVELPSEFTRAHLDQMRNDTKFILDLIERDPDTLMGIQNAVLRSDFADANNLARKVGLTEEQMLENEGGMWGYILVAAVVIGAYAAFSGPDHSSPPPHPPEPVIVDAGTDGGTG